MNCPCGSEKVYELCCAPFITGKKEPLTPEALMRARYTAYTQSNFDYIEQTARGDALEDFSRDAALSQAQEREWLKLDVLFSEEEGDQGAVQFIAFFRFQGEEHLMHEVSSFKKIDGKWYYVKGSLS